MKIRFQADNDLNFAIVRAVRRSEPTISFLSAADAEIVGVSDPEVLDRAFVAGRVIVSHDRRTMLAYFRDRLIAGGSSPGLLIVSQYAAIGPDVEAIILLWSTTGAEELRDRAYHLPSLILHTFPR